MAKFDLRKLEAVKGKQEFSELVIDGVGQLELFSNTLQEEHQQYMSQLKTILTYRILNDSDR